MPSDQEPAQLNAASRRYVVENLTGQVVPTPSQLATVRCHINDLIDIISALSVTVHLYELQYPLVVLQDGAVPGPDAAGDRHDMPSNSEGIHREASTWASQGTATGDYLTLERREAIRRKLQEDIGDSQQDT